MSKHGTVSIDRLLKVSAELKETRRVIKKMQRSDEKMRECANCEFNPDKKIEEDVNYGIVNSEGEVIAVFESESVRYLCFKHLENCGDFACVKVAKDYKFPSTTETADQAGDAPLVEVLNADRIRDELRGRSVLEVQAYLEQLKKNNIEVYEQYTCKYPETGCLKFEDTFVDNYPSLENKSYLTSTIDGKKRVVDIRWVDVCCSDNEKVRQAIRKCVSGYSSSATERISLLKELQL